MKSSKLLLLVLAGFMLTFYGCDSPSTSETGQNQTSSSNEFYQNGEGNEGEGTEQNAETKITEGDLDDSWFILNEGGTSGSMKFIQGHGSPPSGTGSALFTLENSDDEIGLARKIFDGPTSLSSITGLTYSTFKLTEGRNTVKVQLEVNYDDESEGTLVFEPVIETGDVSNMSEWQTWYILTDAGWKANGAPENDNCSVDTSCTLNEITEAFPNASIVSKPDFDGAGLITFKAGPDSPGFQGAVDGFTLSLNGEPASYDFETLQETSDDADDPEETEFEGYVLTADDESGIITLKVQDTELTLTIEDEDVIEEDSDLQTLSELAAALEQDLPVEASGEYYTNADGDNFVTEIELEVDESEEDDDEY